MTKVIGVVSLKGGVGKTSSVVALGDSISQFGKKVLLIDGNFTAPNMGLHLNIVNPENTIHRVLQGKIHAKDALHSFENFDIIPGGVFDNSKINFLKLKDRIKNIKRNYDVVLIDSSPNLNEETLAVMNASDELIVVTTPDHATLGMTLKSVKHSRTKGVNISGLIVNRVYGKNFETSLKAIEGVVDVPILGVIPHDVRVLKSLSEFKPSTSYSKNSKSSEEFKRLAATLVGEKYKPVKVKNLFRWINPKKQDINRTIYYEGVFKD